MLVEAQELTKLYPLGIRALDGVSLTVHRGEMVGIMGRSGSGKSTLLHILGCLDRPSSGRVVIDGLEVTGLPESALPQVRLAKIGFVFQAHNLVPTLTALENVALPLKYMRSGGRRRGDVAREALEAVGLADRMHHLPSQLSGGQQQRVAIARALVNQPALVLADEPTGALDGQTARELLSLLRLLCTQQECTFVVVTHDPLVGKACDRLYHMDQGRLVSG